MRKGGLAVAVRNLTIWSIILSMFAVAFMTRLIRIKKNYTELHHRVNQMERILNESKIR